MLNSPLNFVDPLGLERRLCCYRLVIFFLDLAGKIWASPNTALGLAAGGLSVPFGARPTLGHNAIQFTGVPWPGKGALTLGNVILYNDINPSDFVARYDQTALVMIGLHEEAHTYQYQVLGPLFLPVYFLSGGISADNPFENAADNYAQGTGGWWP